MKQILLGLLLAAPLSAAAQALTPDVMQRITTANALTRQDVALRNALAANGIDAIATLPTPTSTSATRLPRRASPTSSRADGAGSSPDSTSCVPR